MLKHKKYGRKYDMKANKKQKNMNIYLRELLHILIYIIMSNVYSRQNMNISPGVTVLLGGDLTARPEIQR